jgi:DNA-binding MarR family transcriptional regulator
VVTEFAIELSRTYFWLQRETERAFLRIGLTTGRLGLLRTLSEQGPMTVPQMARAKALTRQSIQQHADILAEQGWIRFVENEHHRRSSLLELTPEGERTYARAVLVQGGIASDLYDGSFSVRTIELCTRVLRWLRERLETINQEGRQLGSGGHPAHRDSARKRGKRAQPHREVGRRPET